MPSIPFASISKVECAFSRLLKGIIFEVEMTASPILCLPSCLRGGGLGSKFYFSIIWVDLNFRDLPSRTFYRIHCCWYIMSIFFIFPEAWFWSNSLKLHRFGAQPPLPQISYKMKWKTSKFCFIQIFCYAFFSLCKKWPFLVVRMKSYLIIFQFWATQNEFLVSHPFNSEKWSARADSNFIFYFFLYRESWMKMAWFTKPSQFAWFTKPSQFATGSEHGGIAYTFEVDNW